MFFLRFVVRNVFRAKLRSMLTILGLVIAILAFGLLQTVVRAWYAGADAASATRLISRNAISLTFSMPMYYRDKIRAVQFSAAGIVSPTSLFFSSSGTLLVTPGCYEFDPK